MDVRVAHGPATRLDNAAPIRGARRVPVRVSAVVGRTDVRCPHCDKKLGDYLAGTYRTTCPRCHNAVTITR